MKKIWICVLCSLLLLSSCAAPAATQPQPRTTVPSLEESLPKTQEKTLPATLEQTLPESVDPNSLLTPSERERLKKYFPLLDGSTSLIPYEAGLRSALFGLDYDSAREQVKHSSTWGSFRALLAGEVDMIFTCPMSDEQYQTVGQTGKELVEIPVAMEAFVFVVNAENPVDSLTQEQLRDIYAGKITNWKEVGGLDVPIIAYQRNVDSGSQNFMIDFMGEVPLMEPPITQIAYDMNNLMDMLAINDNSLSSIGYSVYSYAADMYENSSLTKFIKVDGVAPTRLSMNDRSYPLLEYNYAVYENNVSPDSPTALLARYLLSPEAQLAAAKAGYVPTTEIDYDFTQKPEHTLGYYDGVGKGGRAPGELAHTQWVVDSSQAKDLILALKDEALRQEILSHWEENTRVSVKNGYMMLIPYVTVEGSPGYTSQRIVGTGTKPLIWDLIGKKRLSLEEMFYDGVAIDESLEQMLTNKLETEGSIFREEDRVRLRALESWWGVSLDGAYLAGGSSYGETECSVVNWKPVLLMVSQTLRPMEGIFDESVKVTQIDVEYRYMGTYQDVPDGEFPMKCILYRLREEVSPTVEKINKDFIAYIQEHFPYQKSYDRVAELHKGEEHPWDFLAIQKWGYRQLGQRFVMYYSSAYLACDCGAEPYRIYDLETGESLSSWKELYREGWESTLSPEAAEAVKEGRVSVFSLKLNELSYRMGEDEWKTASIPEAYRRY